MEWQGHSYSVKIDVWPNDTVLLTKILLSNDMQPQWTPASYNSEGRWERWILNDNLIDPKPLTTFDPNIDR